MCDYITLLRLPSSHRTEKCFLPFALSVFSNTTLKDWDLSAAEGLAFQNKKAPPVCVTTGKKTGTTVDFNQMWSD